MSGLQNRQMNMCTSGSVFGDPYAVFLCVLLGLRQFREIKEHLQAKCEQNANVN